MIEAMACGTPVIAYDCGSVPEVIEHGVTGFIVRTDAEAVEAVRRLPELDRAAIRRRFEERFSATAMAQRYLDLYGQLAVFEQANVGLAAE
jgi:glycosyltransferase involved in cell wall biosynthesis